MILTYGKRKAEIPQSCGQLRPQLQVARWMGKSWGKGPATVSTTVAGSRALVLGYIKILFNTFI